MNSSSSSNMAIKPALWLGGLSCLLVGLVGFFIGERDHILVLCLVVSVGVTLGAWFIFKHFSEELINEKVKLLYKLTGINKSQEGVESGDVLERAEQDARKWSSSNQAELEQLKRLETYRREFIGNVSHELKTPIFNIQGYIHTLLDGGLEDPEINVDYLKRADKSVERMITIVEDLETITQLESGVITLDKTKFDLVDLIKEVIESVEKKAKDRDIKVKLEKKPDKVLKVIGDKDRIRQVLTNLVMNSVKYGKKGGKTELQLFDTEEKIWVEISDDGIGIPEKHLPRIFERFYRIDKSRSREAGGSGLGLSIVKHIIEAHEEQINVKSKEGEGTTFSFSIQKLGSK
ncbi:MAG: sensor histidine kinase [Bacteroidia bacterium]|nr:sensor histidine kinase [Bacteroidia bacterium]